MDNGKLAERGKPRFVASVFRRAAREEERHKKIAYFPSGVENELLVITNRVEARGGGRGLVACERIGQTHERMKRFLGPDRLGDARWQTRVHD